MHSYNKKTDKNFFFIFVKIFFLHFFGLKIINFLNSNNYFLTIKSKLNNGNRVYSKNENEFLFFKIDGIPNILEILHYLIN